MEGLAAAGLEHRGRRKRGSVQATAAATAGRCVRGGVSRSPDLCQHQFNPRNNPRSVVSAGGMQPEESARCAARRSTHGACTGCRVFSCNPCLPPTNSANGKKILGGFEGDWLSPMRLGWLSGCWVEQPETRAWASGVALPHAVSAHHTGLTSTCHARSIDTVKGDNLDRGSGQAVELSGLGGWPSAGSVFSRLQHNDTIFLGVLLLVHLPFILHSRHFNIIRCTSEIVSLENEMSKTENAQ